MNAPSFNKDILFFFVRIADFRKKRRVYSPETAVHEFLDAIRAEHGMLYLRGNAYCAILRSETKTPPVGVVMSEQGGDRHEDRAVRR